MFNIGYSCECKLSINIIRENKVKSEFRRNYSSIRTYYDEFYYSTYSVLICIIPAALKGKKNIS